MNDDSLILEELLSRFKVSINDLRNASDSFQLQLAAGKLIATYDIIERFEKAGEKSVPKTYR